MIHLQISLIKLIYIMHVVWKHNGSMKFKNDFFQFHINLLDGQILHVYMIRKGLFLTLNYEHGLQELQYFPI